MKYFMAKILFFSAIFSLSGCSLPEIGYRYADWLIKKRILKVVKLYGPEQKKLKVILLDYMDWHQKTMLSRYENALVQLKKDVSSPVEAEVITKHLEKGRTLYYETVLPLSDRVLPLLVTLKEEQIERSKVLLNRKIEERKEELTLAAKELREKKRKQWLDNLEDFLGGVSDEQSALLDKNLNELIYSPRARYAHSVLRVKNFINILEETSDNGQKKSQREEQLKAYFHSWREKDSYKVWRQKAATFLHKIHKTLSKEQKVHLIKKIDYWVKIIRDLQTI